MAGLVPSEEHLRWLMQPNHHCGLPNDTEMKTVSDAVLAMGALVKAVAEGDLKPIEAAELTRMVQAFAKIIETAEIEERIRKLEEATHK
jgi:hypothetical protein